jgi:hypothetical protein
MRKQSHGRCSRTAIAMAFFWPTRTTSLLPRVTPVYQRVELAKAVGRRAPNSADLDKRTIVFRAISLLGDVSVRSAPRIEATNLETETLR